MANYELGQIGLNPCGVYDSTTAKESCGKWCDHDL